MVTMMKLLISAWLVCTTRAKADRLSTHLDDQQEDSHDHRELYSECRENGRFVPLSSTCCQETTDVQFRMTSSFRSASSVETCDQVNVDHLMANFGTYCNNREYNHNHDSVHCVYDVQEHNAACAETQRETCESSGGTLYASDILLECDEFNPIIRIQNSLSCLGTSCTDHDLDEYLWTVGAQANHGALGRCKLVNIHGQTHDEFQRENNKNRAGIVILFVSAVLFFGVAVKLFRANNKAAHHHPRIRVATEEAVDEEGDSTSIGNNIQDENSDDVKEELSPLNDDESKRVSFSSDLHVKNMEGELA